MKKIVANFPILVLLLLMALISCDEEERGPLVTDSTIPGEVSDLSVQNLSGGAKISYKIPSDEDVLYVEATYERNGLPVSTRSSIFKDFVTVEGLNTTESVEVSLVAVDRSENKSTAVSVTINPEKSPLKKIFESIELVQDFGGPRLTYNNEDGAKVEFLLYTIENGQRVYQQSAFIEDGQNTFYNFRGFPPVLTRFGVEVIDRWDNIASLYEADVEPFEEIVLDRLAMSGKALTGDEESAFGWTLNNLFNGVATGAGFHTDQANPGTVVPPYTEGYHMFSVDMGVTAKLSRFKFWPRQGDCCNTPFGHGDPRYFEVWGIDEIPADNGASLDGWTRLVENGEVIKPSGAPLGSNSAEDQALGASGFEFNFPIEAPPVRFIRFVVFENWSGTNFTHVMELEFYGQIEQ
ncbi:DUF5000 domain-containing lipoprotein [Flagellimonas pacifica]|uniref:DUF4959 domain-containing protein n=1 Tax=Flagellimonas pacifica TaxID=1247520 RepID=A0A285ME66_9FLAO|nr:DUF5000 domain-containing lipoprotein [Allomuricauda parva]SNY95408.1 protein of unknown function [Allomuricauda parva]